MADALDPDVTFSPLPAEDQLTPSFGEYFEAAAGNVIRDSPTSSFVRGVELTAAEHGVGRYGRWTGPQPRPTRTPMTAEDASARAKAAGVEVDFGSGQTTVEAAEIMIDRAKRRKVRDTKIAEYQPGMGTQLGVSLLVSLADPINIGSAFIPFVGEARYGALLASASGFGGRTAVRAGLGAVEGLAGAALVEPLIAQAATQEGRDYTMADSLRNLAFGTLFGAGLHAVGGGIAEKLFKRQYANTPVQTPPDITQRLPVEINEAAFRAAISDMIHGRPVASSDVIDLFMRNDPEAARSISYAATLRRDGPEIEDTLNRVEWWKERLDGKTSRPSGEDFMTWLRNKGGLKDDAGVLEADIGGKPDLPSTVYIGAKGAKRAKRGISFDEALAEAISQGFVTNRRQFLDALRAGQRSSPTRKQYRLADEELIAAETEWKQHMETLLADSGVNKNANKTVKARAIVGREQHLIAAERARISQAVDKMLTRNAEYKQAPKVTPPTPFKPEPIKAETATEEPIAVGDTVNIVSGEEKIIATPKPVKVTRILDDPVYGRYGFIEGSETGFPIKDFVRVGEPAAKSAPTAPKTEAEAAAKAEILKDEKSFLRERLKGTKAVDENGDPKLVYHGTPNFFKEFDPKLGGSNTLSPVGEGGVMFTDRQQSAIYYYTMGTGDVAARERALKSARKTLEEQIKIDKDREQLGIGSDPAKRAELEKQLEEYQPGLKEAYLDLQNPLIVDMKGKVYREDRFLKVVKEAREKGHDGVIFKNTYDAGERGKLDALVKRGFKTEDIYMVFDTKQILQKGDVAGEFQIARAKAEAELAIKPTEEPAAPVVQPEANAEPPKYTFSNVIKAVNAAVKAAEGNKVPIESIIADYLPGMSKNKFREIIKELQKNKPNLRLTKDKEKGEVVFFGKLTAEQKEAQNVIIYGNKISAARRAVEHVYPGLKEVSEFPARVVFSPEARRKFQMSEAMLVQQLNKAAERGEVSFRTEEGTPKKTIRAEDFYEDDNQPDLLVKFNKPITDTPMKTATPENQLEVPAEPANVPPAPKRVVETPPADREALNTAELDKATAQYTQLRQQTERRLNAMLTQLPPETAATIKAQLSRIEDDAAELENLYNTAVQCLLKPV